VNGGGNHLSLARVMRVQHAEQLRHVTSGSDVTGS
jgi:hypothetical protein